jgi:hypothetical protein
MRFDSAKFRAFLRHILCLLLITSILPARAQESGVYTVAKVSVSMKAKDAVAAKKRALVLARRQALDTVFRRITPFNSTDRLPVVKAVAIEDMLEGISVRRERNSATRYLATLDFTFSAGAVRKLLGSKGFSISDQQAEPIEVLPIYIDKGKINHTGRDPWRTAWNALDLVHSIVPVRLARASPSFTMESLSNMLGGDVQTFVALRDKYKTGKLIVAIAEPTADGQTLTTRLFGVDRVGSVSLTRNDPVFKRDTKSAARRASKIALGVIEGRWKLAHSPAGVAGEDATPTSIGLVVEFAGMRQWRDIRSRLIKVPGVNGLDVKSLSARTAQVAFQFPGGAEPLSRALTSHGLSLHGGNGSLILRSN